MTYFTLQGDTWDSISFKLFETEKYMSTLMVANPKHTQVTVFSGGVELYIPELAPEISDTLPPWKRGEL
ncbi:tail protein X [Paenibacillus alvei]|uniref:tail protein X n=1 Tax=Paenibacillus alvei TaxID=44250 RepID=UPI0022828B88|nr:tail protein X [Paenibacillus alvei]MCY7486420.1 tail protein X [Paenibacillus alvei]